MKGDGKSKISKNVVDEDDFSLARLCAHGSTCANVANGEAGTVATQRSCAASSRGMQGADTVRDKYELFYRHWKVHCTRYGPQNEQEVRDLQRFTYFWYNKNKYDNGDGTPSFDDHIVQAPDALEDPI